MHQIENNEESIYKVLSLSTCKPSQTNRRFAKCSFILLINWQLLKLLLSILPLPAIVNLTNLIILSCDKETAEDLNEEVVVSELMTAKCQLPETTKPVSQSVDRVFDKYSAGNSYGNTNPFNKVIASSPNKKPVCSRRKLFRTPGSLNYRRMLPYIRRDIQGGNYDKLTTRPEFVRIRNQGRGEREDYGLWFFNSHVFMHLLCTFHCFFVCTQFIIFRCIIENEKMVVRDRSVMVSTDDYDEPSANGRHNPPGGRHGGGHRG